MPVHLRGMGMGLLNLMFFVGGATGSALAGALSGPMGLSGVLAVVAAFPLAARVPFPVFPAPVGGTHSAAGQRQDAR